MNFQPWSCGISWLRSRSRITDRGALVGLVAAIACAGPSRRGDTQGVQTLGRWEWHGRIVAEQDSNVTLERLRIDTQPNPPPRGDVILARFDFNPSPAVGDEYALTVGLELGQVRSLGPGATHALGARDHATVTCLCAPLREDSIRGTYTLDTRGMRQLTGRLDATVYFSEWNRATRHATYSIHQRIDAIK